MKKEQGYALGQALFIVFIWGIFFSLILLLFAKESAVKNDIELMHLLSLNRVSHHRYICGRLAKLPPERWWNTEISQTLNAMEMKTSFFPFGHFLRYQTKYDKGEYSSTEDGLIANRNFPAGDSSYSLVLTDTLYPFVVTPNAVITGNILSRAGPLKKATFQGLQSGYLIPPNGKVYTNNGEISPGRGLIKMTLAAIRQKPFSTNFLHNRARAKLRNQKILLSRLLQSDIHTIEGPGVIIADQKIPLNYKIHFNRYIIFYSETTMTVSANISSSYSIFLSRKEINITGGRHNSQFIAPRVNVKNINLNFPTVISSLPGENSKIRLSGKISGSVIQYPLPQENRSAGNQIETKQGLILSGLLFCSNSFSARGKIIGMAILKYTNIYRAPTSYRNWIDKFTIRPGYRSLIFPFSPGFKNQPEIIQFAQADQFKK